MTPPLKALIFDYGNVLCIPQTAAKLDEMGSVLGLSGLEFEPHYWLNRTAYDAAALEATEYWSLAAKSAGRPIDASGIEALRRLDIESWSVPNPVMIQWVADLRGAGLKAAVLSNMPLDLRRSLTSEAPWFPRFDHYTFSCDIGVCKPEDAIYLHCLEGLGVEPANALFLDDRAENIESARALGIHAHLFANAVEAAVALESAYRLPVPLRA